MNESVSPPKALSESDSLPGGIQASFAQHTEGQQLTGQPTSEDTQRTEALSPNELATINFESFRFSQGNPGLQTYIPCYLRAKFGGRITDEALEESYPATLRRAEAFITRGANKVHGPDPIAAGTALRSVAGEIDRVREGWEMAKQMSDPKDLPWLTEKILKGCVATDYDWIVEKNGRERDQRPEDSQAHPASKFLSQFVYYGLASHSTNVPEYNAMFSDMTKLLEADAFTREQLGPTLRKIIATHVEHYPDELERLPENWRPDTT